MSNFHLQSYKANLAALILISWVSAAAAQSNPLSITAEATACTTIPTKPIYRAKALSKAVVADWTTAPSTYTHDSQGQRVDQYALPLEPVSNERADFVRSGFRHTRSSLQVGFSADHYHQTEQWGQPVQPYGEWRYPNRPFSVPYGQWGPQLPQVLGTGIGVPWFPNRPPLFGNPSGMNGDMNSMQMPPRFPGSGIGNGLGIGDGSGIGNGLGVGPWNTLPAGQDEYYQQAPFLQVPDSESNSSYFNR